MLRSFLLFGAVALLGILMQATLFSGVLPMSVVPDFILILAVYLALFHRSPGGVLGAFLLGLFGDFATGLYLGPSAAGAVVAFVVTAVLVEKIYSESIASHMILLFASGVAQSVTRMVLMLLYLGGIGFSYVSIVGLIWEAAITALIGPFVFRLLSPNRQRSAAATVGNYSVFRWSQYSAGRW